MLKPNSIDEPGSSISVETGGRRPGTELAISGIGVAIPGMGLVATRSGSGPKSSMASSPIFVNDRASNVGVYPAPASLDDGDAGCATWVGTAAAIQERMPPAPLDCPSGANEIGAASTGTKAGKAGGAIAVAKGTKAHVKAVARIVGVGR
jgi:hypothetical protein